MDLGFFFPSFFFRSRLKGQQGDEEDLQDGPTEGWRESEWSGEDYWTLIRRPCLYLGSVGTSQLSQVHSVHQADANYRPLHDQHHPSSCPQGVKCAPNPFPARPITQWTYSSKDWQRNRETGGKDASNPTVLRPLLHLDRGAQWQRRNYRLTHLCLHGF